jgi:hypothetical protein
MHHVSPVLAVPDHEWEDLRTRLQQTRWPPQWPGVGWEAGTELSELRRLVGYWADGYDWRAHEAAINALPSHAAEIDGTPVHYLRFDGERQGALPIVAPGRAFRRPRGTGATRRGHHGLLPGASLIHHPDARISVRPLGQPTWQRLS